MSSKYGLPADELLKIRARDTNCVYCSKIMISPWNTSNRRESATIEHLSPFQPFYMEHGMKLNNIAICCGSCNSSRGNKPLKDWFGTTYCLRNEINADTVLWPVKEYLVRLESHQRSI